MEVPDGPLSRSHRLLLGIVVLFLVDVIWVASSEATKYIYKNDAFYKPLFTTYVKTSMFTIYLLGICLWPAWRDQCGKSNNFIRLEDEEENDMTTSLSDPQFVPIKRSDRSSGTESDDSSVHSVRFSKLAEVRHMSSVDASDAVLARLSYSASLRIGERKLEDKLPMKVVARIAFLFCYLWFLANYTFQVSLGETEAGIATLLSSSSGLFTLVLTALFPATASDRFSLSKLISVLISIAGLTAVCYSDMRVELSLPTGAFLSLVSAFFYSSYLVFIRKAVENEDKMDIPLFFGFVGLFTMISIWPLFFIFHYYEIEVFEWPNSHQWLLIVVNGLVGTVLSEVLWLWGCFLTSSLVATMAIALTIPMAMFSDLIWKNTHYSLLFYLGVIPCAFAFIAVSLLAHYENWDPVLAFMRRIFIACRRTKNIRLIEDCEQTEALIGVNDGDHEA